MFPLCSIPQVPTRADMLRFAIAFALMKARKIVRGCGRALEKGAPTH
jgi:hypothetical protein